ncbi:hypothetical protein A0H76_1990 [Hepatospora eriocheir]|uniref:Uncharacterized protein n=1 Tax=Hepatospora eriocheir TaxID=1081669 RepID=A0A1X0QK99_9MICR|nr:hypothetical protein A0H76_1990 [Hepatospora eriocheir]
MISKITKRDDNTYYIIINDKVIEFINYKIESINKVNLDELNETEDKLNEIKVNDKVYFIKNKPLTDNKGFLYKISKKYFIKKSQIYYLVENSTIKCYDLLTNTDSVIIKDKNISLFNDKCYVKKNKIIFYDGSKYIDWSDRKILALLDYKSNLITVTNKSVSLISTYSDEKMFLFSILGKYKHSQIVDNILFVITNCFIYTFNLVDNNTLNTIFILNIHSLGSEVKLNKLVRDKDFLEYQNENRDSLNQLENVLTEHIFIKNDNESEIVNVFTYENVIFYYYNNSLYSYYVLPSKSSIVSKLIVKNDKLIRIVKSKIFVYDLYLNTIKSNKTYNCTSTNLEKLEYKFRENELLISKEGNDYKINNIGLLEKIN